eukprot:3298037-Prymnesium_polylepis.1
MFRRKPTATRMKPIPAHRKHVHAGVRKDRLARRARLLQARSDAHHLVHDDDAARPSEVHPHGSVNEVGETMKAADGARMLRLGEALLHPLGRVGLEVGREADLLQVVQTVHGLLPAAGKVQDGHVRVFGEDVLQELDQPVRLATGAPKRHGDHPAVLHQQRDTHADRPFLRLRVARVDTRSIT